MGGQVITGPRPPLTFNELTEAVGRLSDDERRVLIGNLIMALGQPKLGLPNVRASRSMADWSGAELDTLRAVIVGALERLQTTPAEFAHEALEQIRKRLAD